MSARLSVPSRLQSRFKFSNLSQKKHTSLLVVKALPAHVLLEKLETGYEHVATSSVAAGSPLSLAKAAILPIADSGIFQVSWEKGRLRLEQAGVGAGFLSDEKTNIQARPSGREKEGVVIRSKRRLERILRRERVQRKIKAHLTVDSVESPAEKIPKLKGDHYKGKQIHIRTRLLTAAEENKLAMATKELMRMEAIKAKLLKVLSREPTSSEWSKALKMNSLEFSQKLRDGHSCRHKLFASNNGLVKKIVKNSQAKGVNLDDLIQDGRSGLLRSIEKFDVDKGFRFSTYATVWIKAAVFRFISKRCAPVHVPDLVEDAAESAFAIAEKKLGGKHINQALETLTAREKEVIWQRFGMDTAGNCKTLEEIGQSYNITRERVRQIQQKAMRKLQDPETSDTLRPFLERKASIQKQNPKKATRKK
ncbi:hypothetical protein O6H91_15G058300 [Diphasiastrum complanatum]|uniref:Uncharacterized protein n=1 Tax=Diphasiastrum complanatum TaxID=34168 RepID=A0ACC2BIS1_DIPCM|nr:hypothetical protein O6H91_15G058300 [Diphasiastrum complanatum]